MTALMNHKLLALAFAGFLSAAPTLAGAQATGVEFLHDPSGVVTLSSSATVQVPNDWMSVQFTTQKEGVDANAVQAQLKEALGAALAQARLVAKADGHVEVQGGGFSLQPRYNSKGAVNGWTGTTSMTVEGRDLATIAELAGKIQTMTVGNLGYSVSREAREKVEGDLAAQAIARFRAKAADYAKAFGYSSFTVREVNVNIGGAGAPPPRPFAMARVASVSDSAPLPTEAGSGSVTANVNGSVQLK